MSWPYWEAKLSFGWHRVDVLDQRGDRFLVHPVGMTSENDEIVASADLRAVSRWFKGDEVMIAWEGMFYPGRVLETEGAWVRVHWYGLPESAQGGWMSSKRLRPQGA